MLNLTIIIFTLVLTVIIIFLFTTNYLFIEHFCYGNTYCNGNKKNALCINQNCLDCGLEARCNKNEDCGPNLCIDGCCDSM